MKIYPKLKKVEPDNGAPLSPMEKLTQKLAIYTAFISVFIFLIKLLFL